VTGPVATINELAAELGLTPRAIRFYEAKGLLSPGRAGDRDGANRVFTRRDRARLLLILRGKRLGFSLAEIREYLDLYDADPSQREQVRLLLGKVAHRIANLEEQRRDLDQALRELHDIEAQCQAALGQAALGRAPLAPAGAD
jgi:DNA-binding transcriptional MerR regulator